MVQPTTARAPRFSGQILTLKDIDFRRPILVKTLSKYDCRIKTTTGLLPQSESVRLEFQCSPSQRPGEKHTVDTTNPNYLNDA